MIGSQMDCSGLVLESSKVVLGLEASLHKSLHKKYHIHVHNSTCVFMESTYVPVHVYHTVVCLVMLCWPTYVRISGRCHVAAQERLNSVIELRPDQC